MAAVKLHDKALLLYLNAIWGTSHWEIGELCRREGYQRSTDEVMWVLRHLPPCPSQ